MLRSGTTQSATQYMCTDDSLQPNVYQTSANMVSVTSFLYNV